MEKAVVDRLEGKWAVLILEGERTLRNVPRAQLPEGTREGDHLEIEVNDGEVVATKIDESARQEAYERIQAKMARLRRGDHVRGQE